MPSSAAFSAFTSGAPSQVLRSVQGADTSTSGGSITKVTEDPAARIERLLDKAEPELQRAFLEIVEQLRDSATLTEIAVLIEGGRLQEALEIAARAGAEFAAAVNGVYVVAGVDTADLLRDKLEAIVSFDQTNQRAVDQMRQNRLRLIREFTENQVEATRQALTEGVTRGINPREQARMFRDSIGLTASQIRAVGNYRDALERGSLSALERQLRDRRFDRTVRRAFEAGDSLTQDQIVRMTDRYRQRMLRYRSEVIARTEALQATHTGSEEMYSQAVDEGIVRADQLERKWNTASDSRVRDSHSTMNGQVRGPNEPFVSGNGATLRYPGDLSAPASEVIQCRCVLSTRIT